MSLSSPEHARLIAAARRAHAAVDALDEAVARALGVGRSDLRCLNLIEQGARSPSRIAACLGLSSAAVTALLDRLERAGLASRAADPADRRAVLVSLTPDAMARAGETYRRFANRLAASAAAMGEGGAERMAAALEAMAAAAEGAVAGTPPREG
jgi:DNA-binding MarR family transcriptional regulator